MDRNFFLALGLSILVLTLWSSWQGERRKTYLEQHPEEAQQLLQDGVETPQIASTPAPNPATGVPSPVTPIPARADQPAAAPVTPERLIVVKTDLYEATLTTRGGGLARWTLGKYVDASVPEKPPVELTTIDPGDPVALSTPFVELGLGDLSQVPWDVQQPDAYTVIFERRERGVTLRKTFRFDPDSYLFHLGIEAENATTGTINPAFAVLWLGRQRGNPDFKEYSLVVLNDGDLERKQVGSGGGGFGAFFGGGDDDGPQEFAGDIDWAGADTRYFLAALIPDASREAVVHLVPSVNGAAELTHLAFRAHPVPPGQSASRELRIYLGPKEPELLEAVGSHLDRAASLGWSWIAPLTRFFSWLLGVFYSAIPNYGVAIILVTVLMRVVTAPLTAKQMRSMKKMGALQPKMKEIQAKYKDDRQLQSQEMMKLYKTAGVSPLGGCLPMVLQMPAFIGLFYALQSAINLRQEPFFGWITDLAAPETLFQLPGLDIPVRLLPLLMGASMVLQQKMTPSTMDPAQARMMMTIMPVMFTVMFYQFPSGLVLYWLVSNLLGIAHQTWMNRSPKTEAT